MNAYPIGNDLTVKWSLLYSDGSVFPLSNYDYELSYRTNRGNKVVTDTSVISVDENILTWTFKGDEQVVSGRYTICLKITLSGSKVVELQYDNAFMLSPLSGFKGAGSEIALQSYCDAIDLKDAVLQARKAMDIAGSAVNTAGGAETTANEAKIIASTANNTSTEAKTIANNAKTVADQAKVTADATAATATQKAEEVAQKEAQLEAALNNLSTDQSGALALSTKVNEHGEKLSELESEVNSISGSEEIIEQTLNAGNYPQINISRGYKKGEKIKFEVLVPADLNILKVYEMSADDKDIIFQHSIYATSGTIVISENYQGRVRILFPPLSAPTQVSVRVTLIGEINKLDKRVETLELDVETLELDVETLENKADSISGSEEIIEQTLNAGNYPQINISRGYKKGEKIKFEVLVPADLNILKVYEMSADDKDIIFQHSIYATSGIIVISENYQGRVRILFPSLSAPTQVSVRVTNEGALKALENNVEALETKVETLESDVETAMQRPPMNSLRIIKRVGCIGDSYTQGYIKLNGQSAEHKEEYSWPFFLSQITGNIYSNWGVGGSTAKDWMNSIISVVDEPNNKCQAYIIGLGINDGSSWSPTATQPGDSTDIGTDNDVYIAYYYKIVQRCLSVNHLAKVFCQTMPNGDNNYNAAIRSVVNYCNNNGQNNVILVDLAQDKYAKSEKFYKNPYFISDASEGHYTAIGYEFMAECLYIILSGIIKNNISEFQNIHQIPYDEI